MKHGHQIRTAKRLGISQAYLSEILRGVKRPSATRAVALERVTGGLVPRDMWLWGDPADINSGLEQWLGRIREEAAA